jgi:pimeloyl-ACP methyl ester carboxylesterase
MHVVSRDGSSIGFESVGSGPPMVLVHGGTADSHRWDPVADLLAKRFTVHVLDRRGRGMSTAEADGPYDIKREGEDVAAVVEAVGENVYVVGHSYGALCSLEAALVTDAIGRMMLYEPPAATPGVQVTEAEALAHVRSAVESGDRELILETFYLEVLHLSSSELDAVKAMPVWEARLKAAPTILRELEQVESFDISERLSKISVPVRFLLGTESPGYFRLAATAIAEHLRRADIVELQGHAHLAIDGDPQLFVSTVFAFADE